MSRNWTFGQKIGGGFAVGVLALLVVGFTGYLNTHRLIENEDWVSHTHQVRRILASLESDLRGDEAATRGYLITGDESFLEESSLPGAGVEKSLDELRTFTSDNVEQQRRLDALRPLIDQKLAVLKEVIRQGKA